MPSRPLPGTQWARFVAHGRLDQKTFSNDFWYSVTSGSISSTTPFHAVAAAWWAAMTSPWADAITTSTTLLGVTAYFNDGTGTFGIKYYNSVPGTGIGDTLPEDVAVVIQKLTADFAKAGKGRFFFSGAGVGDTTGSYLNSSGITDWQAFAVQIKSGFVTSGLTLSPAHFEPSTGLLKPIVDTPVISLLGTQRRRKGNF